MLHIRTRTEYSFRKAYGPINNLVDIAGEAMGIADSGTWGHVPFSKACKKAGVKPIFGVEIAVVVDSTERTRQTSNMMAFIAKNNEGLSEIYDLVTKSTNKENFYYFPRLSYSDLFDVSENVIILSGTHPEWGLLPLTRKGDLYIEINPMSSKKALEFCKNKNLKPVATSDNFYPRVSDRKAYEVLVGMNRMERTMPMHLLNEHEMADCIPWIPDEAIENTYNIVDMCNVDLPTAQMISFSPEKTLEQMCIDGAPERGIDLEDPIYKARLKRELDMIDLKQFHDYFYVIADMINYANQHMLVGRARGSSS